MVLAASTAPGSVTPGFSGGDQILDNVLDLPQRDGIQDTEFGFQPTTIDGPELKHQSDGLFLKTVLRIRTDTQCAGKVQGLELAGQRDDQDCGEPIEVRGVLEDHCRPDPGLLVGSTGRDFDKVDIPRNHAALSHFGLDGGKRFVTELIPGSQFFRQV